MNVVLALLFFGDVIKRRVLWIRHYLHYCTVNSNVFTCMSSGSNYSTEQKYSQYHLRLALLFFVFYMIAKHRKVLLSIIDVHRFNYSKDNPYWYPISEQVFSIHVRGWRAYLSEFSETVIFCYVDQMLRYVNKFLSIDWPGIVIIE